MTGCSFPECDRSHKTGGLCSAHAEQRRVGKPLTSIRVPRASDVGCSYENCTGEYFSSGWCAGHYTQQRRGKTMQPVRPQRSKGAHLLRDADGNKLCPDCKKWLPENSFSKSSSKPGGLQPVCRFCARYKTIASKYHITSKQYLAMLQDQDGCCAVCKDVPAEGKHLSVDHNHKCCSDPGKSCGKCIRRLLCFKCNAGIGLMRDSPELLRAAANYLEKF